MEKKEKYADLKHNKFAIKLVSILTFVLLATFFFGSFSLYSIRNADSRKLAERFVKNNEIILSEAGEIDFDTNPTITNKSEEIARNLRENNNLLFNKETKESKVRMLSDANGVLQPLKIVGTKKTIEVEVYLIKYIDMCVKRC